MRLLTLCLALAAANVHADSAVLPTVTTELKRDSNALPYGRINELLTRLKQHGEGLFRMDFTVDRAKTKVDLPSIRMAVRSDDADYPVRIDSEGRIDLPLLPLAEAKSADLATNVPKGQMAVRVARTLREELLPFYLRWLFPRMEAVRICSDTPTWELEWRENGKLMGLPLPAADTREPETKPGQPSRPCAVLTGQENWPDSARLVPPPGTKLSIKF
ncbi:MAG: hypothetical protein EOP35_22540 [Rubrivivax sp.]|nr:MAG: hypothetical protein EOP35_22540 [Rubrivivax sp.]